MNEEIDWGDGKEPDWSKLEKLGPGIYADGPILQINSVEICKHCKIAITKENMDQVEKEIYQLIGEKFPNIPHRTYYHRPDGSSQHFDA